MPFLPRPTGSRRGHHRSGLEVAVILALSTLLLPTSPVDAVPSWAPSEAVGSVYPGDATEPAVASDAGGNLTAAWVEPNGTHTEVFASRRTASGPWSAPFQVSLPLGTNGGVRVGADSRGNAFVAWADFSYSVNVYLRRYDASSGWGQIQALGGASGSTDIDLAVEASGRAIAVWEQWAGVGPSRIWFATFTPGSGWSSTTNIEPLSGTWGSYFPRISLDANGTAQAAWMRAQSTGAIEIWSSARPSGAAWTAPVRISTATTSEAWLPRISAGEDGSAAAVWFQKNGSLTDVWANLYSPGAGWSTATLIEADTSGNATVPDVEVDACGNVMAVWMQSNGSGYSLLSRRFTPSAGWDNVSPVETDNAAVTGFAGVEMDGCGRAMTAWTQGSAAAESAWWSQFEDGAGWTAPGLVSSGAGGAVHEVALTVTAAGDGAAAWTRTNGTERVLSAGRFAGNDTVPPTLQVTAPANGSVTNLSSATIQGAVERGALVRVGAVSLGRSCDGTFAFNVSLVHGNNTFVVTAMDASGNAAVSAVTVRYNDPVISALEDALAQSEARAADLEARLADAEAQRDAAVANLSQLGAELAAAQADLDATLAQLDLATANQTATLSDLAAAQAALQDSLSQLAMLEADANATAAELDTARSALASASAEAQRQADLANGSAAERDAALANASAASDRVLQLEARLAAAEQATFAAETERAALSIELNSTRADLEAAQAGANASSPGPQADPTPLAVAVAAVGVAVGVAGTAVAWRSRRHARPPLP